MDYCLPSGYQPRLEPRPRIGEDNLPEWLPDVHLEAASIARKLGARRIIEIGCGSAERLASLYPAFDIVGVGRRPIIEACRQRYGFGSWLELDLDCDDSLGLDDLGDSLILCAGLLERLVHPERLLSLLSDAFARGVSGVVLSTPDRAMSDGPDHTGPPSDTAHSREWTLSELERLLSSAGLDGVFGRTRTSDLIPSLGTILAILPGRSEDVHAAVLDWFDEYERRLLLVEERERAIGQQLAWTAQLRAERDWFAQQLAWTAQLRAERDWFAQQRAAWEARALHFPRRLAGIARRGRDRP